MTAPSLSAAQFVVAENARLRVEREQARSLAVRCEQDAARARHLLERTVCWAADRGLAEAIADDLVDVMRYLAGAA